MREKRLEINLTIMQHSTIQGGEDPTSLNN